MKEHVVMRQIASAKMRTSTDISNEKEFRMKYEIRT